MPTPRKYPRIKIAGRPGEHFAHLVMSETETIALAGAWSTPEVAFAAAQAELVNEQAGRAGSSSDVVAAAIVTPTPAPVAPEPAPVTPAAPAATAARAKMPKPVPTRCPDCKRRVRRSFEKASSWPGTVVMMDRTGRCGRCKKIQQQLEQLAGAEPPQLPEPRPELDDSIATSVVVEAPRRMTRVEADTPPVRRSDVAAADALDDLVEQLEPEPSKPKSRKRRADHGKAYQGRPEKAEELPATCPSCNRPVRQKRVKVEDAPGTVQAHLTDGTCLTCVRNAERKLDNRRANRAEPLPMIQPPAPFEEPRRSTVVPAVHVKAALAPPVPKPPPVTVLGSGLVTGPMDSFEQTQHSLGQFMARRQARINRPTPSYINRKAHQ